jgi:hypothetical protein
VGGRQKSAQYQYGTFCQIRTTSGQAAAPPSTVMNSRRQQFIRASIELQNIWLPSVI